MFIVIFNINIKCQIILTQTSISIPTVIDIGERRFQLSLKVFQVQILCSAVQLLRRLFLILILVFCYYLILISIFNEKR